MARSRILPWFSWGVILGSALLSACMPVAAAAPSATSDGSQVQAANVQHTLTGDIHYIRKFHSAYLPDDRDLIVYLPPDYAQNRTKHYPVLYMHDGNNIFDSATAFLGNEWGLDETTQQLIADGQLPSIIIVGVYNTPNRIFEYTWTTDNSEGSVQGGGGKQYAEMMVNEIKPLIDHTYRTLPDRDNTAVMGSSLGGLISYYLGLNYPDTFGKIGLMSPSLWWDNLDAQRDVASLPQNLDIWLDMGTKEGDSPAECQANLDNARSMEKALIGHGYQLGTNLGYYEDKGAAHNETYWSRRVYRPLEFFFPEVAQPSSMASPKLKKR